MNILYCMCASPQGLLWPVESFTLGTNGPLVMTFWVHLFCVYGFVVFSQCQLFPPPTVVCL